jgi:hypothetical protein
LDLETKAIFDPQVDHLYVSPEHFKNFLAPAIQSIYGPEVVTCDDDECSFRGQDCDTVYKNLRKNVGIQFSLGPKDDASKQYHIYINLEDYLVDGKDVGQIEPICFLPVFVIHPPDDAKVQDFTTWFLGSMILDRYFVINQNEFSEKVPGGPNLYPLVGVYDKWRPTHASRPVIEKDDNQRLDPDDNDRDSPNFKTFVGHCVAKSGTMVEGEDWKNMGKGGPKWECRHTCNLDEKCSAYEYAGNELLCGHWFGEVSGSGEEGASCYVKDVAKAEPITEPESSGAGTFWAIFLTLVFLGGLAVLGKLYGK